MVKKIKDLIKHILKNLSLHKVGAYSAQSAFFIIFSIFPFLILILSLTRYLPFEHDQIFSFMTDFMPENLGSFFSDIVLELKAGSSSTLTIVSGVVLLWSASRGVVSVIGGLNSVYENDENRGYLKIKLVSVFYTLSFVISITITMVLLVFGNRILDLVESKFSSYYALAFLIVSLRYLIGFCILVLFFTIIYKALPTGKLSFFYQLPGAVFSAIGWMLFSVLFSFYIDNFSNYSNLYGSITAIILLMLWLYICMYILFIGAEINLWYKNGDK